MTEAGHTTTTGVWPPIISWRWASPRMAVMVLPVPGSSVMSAPAFVRAAAIIRAPLTCHG
jgi:hypothetical protein